MKPNPEETYSPRAVTGVGFDDIMRKVAKLPPDKPKKKSRPNTAFHVTSKFTKKQLHRKSVEFSITQNGIRTFGTGEFDVSQPKIIMAISIHSETEMERGHFRVTVIPLTQAMVDCIRRHPDEKVADFRLVLA